MASGWHDVDLALKEFFNKGIVGVVARANQRYLANNPAREKIFMQLLKQLRELLLIVHRKVTVENCIAQIEQTVGQTVSDLNAQENSIEVQGTLGPHSKVEFVQVYAVHVSASGFEFTHKSSSLSVEPASDGDQLKLVLTDVDGQTRTETAQREQMRSLCFRFRDGEVAWSSLADDTATASASNSST